MKYPTLIFVGVLAVVAAVMSFGWFFVNPVLAVLVAGIMSSVGIGEQKLNGYVRVSSKIALVFGFIFAVVSVGVLTLFNVDSQISAPSPYPYLNSISYLLDLLRIMGGSFVVSTLVHMFGLMVGMVLQGIRERLVPVRG